jgi:hypothetical protein
MTKQRIGFCCKWLNSREESKDKAAALAKLTPEERALFE